MRHIMIAIAAVVLMAGSLGAAEEKTDPISTYAFSGQEEPLTVASFDGRSVAVWGLCNS